MFHQYHCATCTSISVTDDATKLRCDRSKEYETNDTTNIVKIPYEKMSMFFIN
jgi:hypothetical protein